MLEYNVQNTLKSKENIPDNIQHIINIFREKIINAFDYKVERVITYKCFVENNGKFIPIFDNSKIDKKLGIFNLNNKFFKDPFYQEYLLERESLFTTEFENILSFIERRYCVLKDLRDQDGTPMFNTVKAFRKAVSGGLNTGRNFGAFQVGYKFLKQHFSFIHGTFRERNFDLFHGEKKKFVRMELSKNINTYISLCIPFDDVLSVSIKYSTNYYGTDCFKEEKVIFNNLKEKNLFITLYNKFNIYASGISRKNPYIANAIYSMGNSKLSKRKISLAYSLINDVPIDLNNDISLLRLKNKEYLTDTAYKFRQELSLSGKIHPISLVTNHDYVDFSAENLDLFMNKILSYNSNSFLNGTQHSYMDKTKKLFSFIDLYGEDFTKDILLREFNISDFTKDYKYIKKAFDLNFNIYLRFSPYNNSTFVVSSRSSLSKEEETTWETNLSNNFNALIQDNFLEKTDFKYYEQPLFKDKKHLFFSAKEETFFDSINHIFFFSLLSMTGVKIQELSFNDCINTELKSNLREYNQVFENFVLDSATDDITNTFPIISRKKHLLILSFVKKINLFLLSSEWEVDLNNFRRLRSFFDVTSLYKYLSYSEINLKEFHKLFLKKLRTNPDTNELLTFFDRHNIYIDPEIRF